MKQERLEQARTACTQIFGSTSKATMDIFVRAVQWADENPDTPNCDVANCPNRNGELVRADNSKVIANLQEENGALKAELAPFRRMKEEYEKYCKDNEGNDTIVRDENGHISVIFGDGKVLLSMVSAELKEDNTPVHGIVLTALKEKHEMGVDLYNGKSVPELAKEGVVYQPSVVLLFKNAKGVHGLEEFTKEVKRRFAADNEEKGVV